MAQGIGPSFSFVALRKELLIQQFITEKNLISAPFHIRRVGENSGLADQADRLQAETAHRVRMFSGMILFMNKKHEFLLSVEEK